MRVGGWGGGRKEKLLNLMNRLSAARLCASGRDLRPQGSDSDSGGGAAGSVTRSDSLMAHCSLITHFCRVYYLTSAYLCSLARHKGADCAPPNRLVPTPRCFVRVRDFKIPPSSSGTAPCD